MSNNLKNKTGFSLIEMIVVVVLITVLAAMALPRYIESINRSRRSEGEAAVLALLTGAKTYYQNQDPPTFTNAAVDNLGVNVSDYTAHWGLAVTVANDVSITITAVGQADTVYDGLSVTLNYTLGDGVNNTVITNELGEVMFN